MIIGYVDHNPDYPYSSITPYLFTSIEEGANPNYDPTFIVIEYLMDYFFYHTKEDRFYRGRFTKTKNPHEPIDVMNYGAFVYRLREALMAHI